jgi:DinB superfamily
MKKIKTIDLLESLKGDSRQIILETTYLLHEDPKVLLQQPDAGKWSVAQILEHLNSYGRYYLPLIERSIDKQYPPKEYYRPGLLGEYFTKSMLPKKNGQITNKMQAPRNHRPAMDIDNNKVIQEFLQQEHLLLDLLEQAAGVNIEKIRIPISISRFIRLQLGDTFRFLIAHHQRHFVQANNALKSLKHTKTQALRMHGV